MRRELWAIFVAFMLALMSELSITAVRASPLVNAEGTMTWVWVEFTPESPIHVGVNDIYIGTGKIESTGTFAGTVTDAFVEIWHKMTFLNLRDVLTFDGTVDGKKGTLTICLVGTATLPALEWTCHWAILGGTDDLANLAGQGSMWGTGMTLEYSGMIEFE